MSKELVLQSMIRAKPPPLQFGLWPQLPPPTLLTTSLIPIRIKTVRTGVSPSELPERITLASPLVIEEGSPGNHQNIVVF